MDGGGTQLDNKPWGPRYSVGGLGWGLVGRFDMRFQLTPTPTLPRRVVSFPPAVRSGQSDWVATAGPARRTRRASGDARIGRAVLARCRSSCVAHFHRLQSTTDA